MSGGMYPRLLPFYLLNGWSAFENAPIARQEYDLELPATEIKPEQKKLPSPK